MSVAKINARAISFKYNGVVLSITKMNPKHKRNLSDTTDSADYDTGTDMVHHSQQPASTQTELAVEGYFDLNSTNLQLIAPLFSSTAAQPIVLNLNAATPYGHGNFDCQDFETDMALAPTPQTIGWKATFLSNGVFTPGS